MKRLLLVAVSMAISPAFANDTAAVLTTGGLEFVSHGEIAMESEELFISTDEIRVTYVFRNDSDEDHHLLVAFPMPDIVPDHFSPVAYPMGPADNLFEFDTTFDGEPVTAELHEYAYAAGVDRTKELSKLGLPLVPISQAAIDAVDGLGADAAAELLHLGMLVTDEYDDGQGWEEHFWPGWNPYRATYTWEATFPAGERVTVEHRYRPSVGGTAGIAFLSEPYEGYDPAAEYLHKYCTDDDFLAAVRATMTNPEEPWTAPFTESWISYILTTGGNWAGGIENFRLVVDKGDEDNLVSFCGEGVRRIGPTTFEMVREDFWPEDELDILILQRHEQL